MNRKSANGGFDLTKSTTSPTNGLSQDESGDRDRGHGNQNEGESNSRGYRTASASTDPVRFVLEFINSSGIEILYNGTLEFKNAPLSAATPDQIDAFLDKDYIDQGDLLDVMVLYAITHKYPWTKTHLAPALRQIVRREKRRRRATILRRLLESLSESERGEAEREWQRVAPLFEVAPSLSIGVLKHAVWQVKQKSLGRNVDHHLMPLIWSAVQGSGKTTFVHHFCTPLRDLVAKNAVLRQIADERAGEIFRYMVISVDDMEVLERTAIADLKAVMTGDNLSRRKMSTSNLATIRQWATLIGTANSSVSALIRDETGHRRFADLPFRNGNAAKGGDADLWRTVQSLDYTLLWRSIDAFAPSPIMPVLRDLYKHQDGTKPADPLFCWLCDLDVNSESVRAITVREGVRSDPLRMLYQRQTGQQITHKRFPVEMARLFSDERVPFADQVETRAGMVYRLKPEFRTRPQSTKESSAASPASTTTSASTETSGSSEAAERAGSAASQPGQHSGEET